MPEPEICSGKLEEEKLEEEKLEEEKLEEENEKPALMHGLFTERNQLMNQYLTVRIFFRNRLRANACLMRFFSPGFR